MNQSQKTVLKISGIIVLVLVILSVVLGSFLGWWDGFGMMGRGMMGGFGTMFLMPFLWIVILGLAVWAITAAFHKPGESDSATPKSDLPMDILKKRYAMGEIDKEEYEEKKKDLV